jgi:hypothetical protein
MSPPSQESESPSEPVRERRRRAALSTEASMRLPAHVPTPPDSRARDLADIPMPPMPSHTELCSVCPLFYATVCFATLCFPRSLALRHRPLSRNRQREHGFYTRARRLHPHPLVGPSQCLVLPCPRTPVASLSRIVSRLRFADCATASSFPSGSHDDRTTAAVSTCYSGVHPRQWSSSAPHSSPPSSCAGATSETGRILSLRARAQRIVSAASPPCCPSMLDIAFHAFS